MSPTELAPLKRNRNHIGELDGLRGIAILLVLWGHLKLPFLGVKAPTWFHSGVDLFFLLSGFLITRILLFNREHGVPIHSFILKRVARILPVAIVAVVAVQWFWPSNWNFWAIGFSLNLRALFMQMDGTIPINHFWSLCVEEQFYMLFPWLVLFCSRRVAFWACVLGCGMGVALLATSAWWVSVLELDPKFATNAWARNQFWTRGWPLLLGALMAFREPQLRKRPWILLVIASLAFLSSTVVFAIWRSEYWQSHFAHTLVPQLFVSAVFAYALWTAFTKTPNLFSDKILGWCGKISYGLYLYHFPIYFGLKALKLEPTETVMLSIAISFFAASLSFYYMETPIRRLIANKYDASNQGNLNGRPVPS